MPTNNQLIRRGREEKPGMAADFKFGVKINLFAKYAAIKSGMAADFKFGGRGSFSNLPWVSAMGPGPNGKMISGVTYRYSANQIRIVCACHGSHLSPEEFVRHASEEKVDAKLGPCVVFLL